MNILHQEAFENQKALLDNLAAIQDLLFRSFEKLVNANMQVMRASLSAVAEKTRQATVLTEPKQALEYSSGWAQDQDTERLVLYFEQIGEILRDAQSEIAQLPTRAPARRIPEEKAPTISNTAAKTSTGTEPFAGKPDVTAAASAATSTPATRMPATPKASTRVVPTPRRAAGADPLPRHTVTSTKATRQPTASKAATGEKAGKSVAKRPAARQAATKDITTRTTARQTAKKGATPRATAGQGTKKGATPRATTGQAAKKSAAKRPTTGPVTTERTQAPITHRESPAPAPSYPLAQTTAATEPAGAVNTPLQGGEVTGSEARNQTKA